MDNTELQNLVEKVSLEFFDQQFKHKARFNMRLKTTAGRYLTRTHDLEFNYYYYKAYELAELINIIKHELCHYHLHLANKGYLHRDKDFKTYLAKVGGTRYAKPLNIAKNKKQAYRYLLICIKCSFEYYRKRKVDIKRYRCGKCRGELVIKEIF